MKACSKCNEEKPLEQFGQDKRSKDGHASACLSCKGETKGSAKNEAAPNLEEKLDKVVQSTNEVIGDINSRVTGLEGSVTEIAGSMSEVLKAVRAMNSPVNIRKGYEAGSDGLGESYVAEAAEVDGESIMVHPDQRSLDDPHFKKKFDHEAFMNELVTIHISDTSEK